MNFIVLVCNQNRRGAIEGPSPVIVMGEVEYFGDLLTVLVNIDVH